MAAVDKAPVLQTPMRRLSHAKNLPGDALGCVEIRIFFAREEQAAVCGDGGREQTEIRTAEPNTEVLRSESAAGDTAGFVLQPSWAAPRNSS
ncbi:hypothetical protein NDU88_002717 [Pleurodeles waltl]|uniref:Uncharacterized protein n=1 Tax=Pleurodeles waltl TaxID=8319 RepID=A0AAV7SCV1_PLEWA|nr:hypothetical protein NDU88_002717 [Pleurodeles waltl]